LLRGQRSPENPGFGEIAVPHPVSALYFLTVARNIKLGLRALLVLFAFLLNTPLLSGLVLCVDQDGHLELEYSLDGKCESAAGTAQGLTLHAHEEDTDCGLCTDYSLLLSTGDSIRSIQGLQVGGFQAPVAPVFFPAPDQLNSKSRLYERPPPQDSRFLAHVRTVLLLI
jgi:hypothetical protein